MVAYILAAIVALHLLAVIIGVVLGRVRMRGCCAVADPARDVRMRAAFEDEPPDR